MAQDEEHSHRTPPRPCSPSGEGDDKHRSSTAQAQPPAFNAPLPVLLCVAAFVVIHAGREWLLEPALEGRLLITFALFPPLYEAALSGMPTELLPGGTWGLLAAPFTHFFLHANWTHVIMNSLWMLVFGTPVARRIGGMRFLALALLSAAGGGLAWLALHWGQEALLVGASGGISGLMGASVRLIYAHGTTLAEGLHCDVRAVRPLTFTQALTLPGPRQFILAWIGINIIISFIGFGAGGGMQHIAGDAHLAGFFTGMALFGLLDVKRR